MSAPPHRLALLAPGPAFRLLLALLSVAFLWAVIRPLLAPVVLATATVVVLGPLHLRLERRFGTGGNRVALLSLGLFTLFAGAPLLVAAVLFVAQAGRVVEDLAGRPGEEALSTGLRQLVEHYLEWLGTLGERYLGRSVDIRAIAESRLQEAATGLYESLPGLAGWLVRLLLAYAVFYVVLFFLLRDGRRLVATLGEISPLEERHARQILGRLAATIRAVFLGSLITAIFQAAVGAVGFALAGFGNFMVWGSFLLVASFIPVFGCALVWAPATLFLAATGQSVEAALLLVVGLVISTTDNLLRLLLIGRQTTLHPLVLFVAVFGGLATWGPMGIVYGLLLAAALVEVLQIYRADREPLPEDPSDR